MENINELNQNHFLNGQILNIKKDKNYKDLYKNKRNHNSNSKNVQTFSYRSEQNKDKNFIVINLKKMYNTNNNSALEIKSFHNEGIEKNKKKSNNINYFPNYNSYCNKIKNKNKIFYSIENTSENKNKNKKTIDYSCGFIKENEIIANQSINFNIIKPNNKIPIPILSKSNNKKNINKSKRIKKTNNIFIVDKKNHSEINICGVKNKNDTSQYNINNLNEEQRNKLGTIDKNKKYFSNNELINYLYDYMIGYNEIKKMEDTKNKEDDNEIDINITLLKKRNENKFLNLQKNFLMNELIKSTYNNEKLQKKYKNELERIDAYLNKIKFDLNEE